MLFLRSFVIFWFIAFCLVLLPLTAQQLRISEGPKDEQVLQRDLEGFAAITFRGTAAGKRINGKKIEARVRSASGVVTSLDWAPAGQIVKQDWTAGIRGIPVGGPYRIELRVQGGEDVAAVDNILVGDLWILAGQSNMEGVGDLVDVQAPDPLVHSFDMADRWQVAEEPLHTQVGSVDPVHWGKNAQGEYERLTGDALHKYIQQRKKGAGLGLPFAVTMVKRTGVPIGLIPCAHGGTSMDQWDPALKSRMGDSLYGSMYRRFVAAGSKVKGMLWYQGESDANPKAAPLFKQKFEAFVRAVRSDFGQPDLPFYYVQIGRHISDQNVLEWNQVQQDQLEAEREIPHASMAVSVDLSLDDGIHIGTQDQKRLGKRLADRVCRDLFPRMQDFGELKTGPRPVAAIYENGVVRVRFAGVNQRLNSEGRISGFTIHNAAGHPIPAIFRARVDPAEASTVLLYISGKLPERATLHYGFGKDPYCNVRDAADFAVPAFGPLAIQGAP